MHNTCNNGVQWRDSEVLDCLIIWNDIFGVCFKAQGRRCGFCGNTKLRALKLILKKAQMAGYCIHSTVNLTSFYAMNQTVYEPLQLCDHTIQTVSAPSASEATLLFGFEKYWHT